MKHSSRRYRTSDKSTRKSRKDVRRRPVAIIFISLVLILGAVFLWGILDSRALSIQTFNITYDTLPQAFDGFRIVQLSDLHSRSFSEDQQELYDLVNAQSPDIIVLTGDMVDADTPELQPCTVLCERLVQIAPVYWVKGNHYYKLDEEVAQRLHDELTEIGVVPLENSIEIINREEQSIFLCGFDDPRKLYATEDMPTGYAKSIVRSVFERQVEAFDEEFEGGDAFRIALSHRPACAELFTEAGYALALAGHTHGGQICLPGGIEVIGEYSELFPGVKSGYNDVSGMPLIISSGLGYSNINLRLFNPPEIVLVELRAE